jgi:hypothetical protein
MTCDLPVKCDYSSTVVGSTKETLLMDAANQTRSGPAALTHPGFPDQRSEGERGPHRVI